MAVQTKDEMQELLDHIGEDLDLLKESLEIMGSMLEDIRDNVENGDEVIASLKFLSERFALAQLAVSIAEGDEDKFVSELSGLLAGNATTAALGMAGVGPFLTFLAAAAVGTTVNNFVEQALGDEGKSALVSRIYTYNDDGTYTLHVTTHPPGSGKRYYRFKGSIFSPSLEQIPDPEGRPFTPTREQGNIHSERYIETFQPPFLLHVEKDGTLHAMEVDYSDAGHPIPTMTFYAVDQATKQVEADAPLPDDHPYVMEIEAHTEKAKRFDKHWSAVADGMKGSMRSIGMLRMVESRVYAQ